MFVLLFICCLRSVCVCFVAVSCILGVVMRGILCLGTVNAKLGVGSWWRLRFRVWFFMVLYCVCRLVVRTMVIVGWFFCRFVFVGSLCCVGLQLGGCYFGRFWLGLVVLGVDCGWHGCSLL